MRITLMNEFDEINSFITSRQPTELLQIILYGDFKFKEDIKEIILTATTQFMKIVIDLTTKLI